MNPKRLRNLTPTLLLVFAFGMVSNVYAQSAGSRVPLVDAVRHGDVAAVRALIAKKADVNATELDGTTALHWAAHLNDVASMDLLLKAGANPKAQTRDGATPFALACYKGNAAVISRLLAVGEDAKAVLGGEPALTLAVRAGNPVAVRALLAAGADPNLTEPVRGQSVLMFAAADGNAAVIQTLVEAGANVNARSKGVPAPTGLGGGRIPRINDPIGLRAHRDPTWSVNQNGLQFTPIMWAAREGRIEAVKALLDAGANINDEKPGDGTTVLVLAILNRHYELAGYLIDRGADPNRGPGFTALHQLAWTRRLNGKFGPLNPEPTGNLDSLEVARKLLAHGVEIDAQMTKSFGDGYRNRMNRIGATAFMLSSKLADLPMVKLLVAKGADIHITNADGDSPLMLAAGVAILNPGGEDAGTETEVLETVKYLAEELKIDVNAINKNNETALHGAAYRGYDQVAKYLLDRGAKLEVTNVIGWKPLSIADGVFYAGFFKAQPQVATVLRESYRKQGLPVPDPPKVNDTTLLTISEKFAVGDTVMKTDGFGYIKISPADAAANPGIRLLRVTEVDAQGQITSAAP